METHELELLIEKYGPKVYSFCRYLTGGSQEAEDLYQDTFLKVWELRERLQTSDNVQSYILSVAIRIWKNRKRKFAWRKRIADQTSLDQSAEVEHKDTLQKGPEDQMIENETIRMVQTEVLKLPEKYKLIVLLYYMEERSVGQIAEILNIPAGTVKSRLYQARKLLEQRLEVVLDER